MKKEIDVWQELFQSIVQGLLAGDTEDRLTLKDVLEAARQGANEALDMYLEKKNELN